MKATIRMTRKDMVNERLRQEQPKKQELPKNQVAELIKQPDGSTKEKLWELGE